MVVCAPVGLRRRPVSPMSEAAFDQSLPEAVRALLDLEEQCGSKQTTIDILRLLRSITEYAGRGNGTERHITTTSTGYLEKVGKYAAGREVLALIGFVSRKDDGLLCMGPEATVDPAVMCALNQAFLRLSDTDSGPSGIMSAPTTPLTPAESLPEDRPSFLSPVSRRHPLSNRLPNMPSLDNVIVSDTSCISNSIRDGSSCVCPDCHGVIPVERFEQHSKHWCPGSSKGLIG